VNSDRQTRLKNLQLIALAVSTAMLPFSIFLCHAAIGIFLVIWLFEGSWQEKWQIIKTSALLQCFILLFIAQLGGISYSDFKSSGWDELGKKSLLLIVPIALATTSNKMNTRQVRTLLSIFVITCIIAAFICIGSASVQVMNPSVGGANLSYLNSSLLDLSFVSSTWLYFSYINLAAGIDIHPAYLSLYIAFSILIVLFELVHANNLSFRKQVLFTAVVLFLSLFEIFLATRIIIITLLLIVGSGTLYLFVNRFKRKFAWVGLSLIIVTLVVLRINPVSYYRNVQEISKSNFEIGANSLYKTSTEIRASLWWLSWKAYLSTNPIVGSGTGSVKAKIEEQSNIYQITNIIGSFDPHNEFLYFLIGNGAFGLLVFLACSLLPLTLAIREKDFLYIGFAILCGALFMTESALELQKGIAFIAIMHSLLAFQRKSYQYHNRNVALFSVRD
jgi:hypothetical protein